MRYLDFDNLKQYDSLLKDYIDQKIAAAISNYRQEDLENDSIIEDMSDETENNT